MLISITKFILIIIGIFILGVIVGVFITAIMSANNTTIRINDPNDAKPKFFCKYANTGICIGCPNQLDCYDNLNNK